MPNGVGCYHWWVRSIKPTHRRDAELAENSQREEERVFSTTSSSPFSSSLTQFLLFSLRILCELCVSAVSGLCYFSLFEIMEYIGNEQLLLANSSVK